MTKIDLKTLKSIEKLVKIGIRNDSGEKMILNFSKMDRVKKDGQLIMLYLKTEGENYNIEQVNITLGQGKGLNQFNNNIIELQLIKIIKK